MCDEVETETYLMSLCVTIIGLVVLVSLVFVSIPALVIVMVGCLVLWFLKRSSGGEGGDASTTAITESCKDEPHGTHQLDNDDALSVDSGVWAARDFAMGAVKDELVRPHTQPPAPPVGEVSAFRTIKETDGRNPNDVLYERYTDVDHYEQRMSRGHDANLKHLYTSGLDRAMQAARTELPMKDPNLVPLNPDEPLGCPRPMGKL